MRRGIHLPLREGGSAYVPPPLPPSWHPDKALLQEAEEALAEWSRRASEESLHERVAQEASASSRIEGIDAPPEEILRGLEREEEGAPVNLARLHLLLPDLPPGRLSRLATEAHALLFRNVATPFPRGKYRTSQVWIGGRSPKEARYVPPPPVVLEGAMDALDEFLETSSLPPLWEALLLHAQFEAIHPFPDGNGRVGRFLIQAHLFRRGLLPSPSFPLPLSPYLLKRREAYYNALLAVTKREDWAPWGELFLRGILSVAGRG